ncbi:DUF1045 domain-containing protein [Consotaella salsifontis]|uniref:Putative phosphonate metabolism protein n=1 Tax=Consotaella salsifontis TaxID=1365950 RepID=A0A1T4T7D9_9HYPH|nr:DUF1045 domain-containing protein [Consotaella salsifontis]SKA36402.1 putative phosphonate metabolism protein [Consotaella salsifontis]
MRASIFYTPPADHPLTRATSIWLGRDAFTGARTREADAAIDPLIVTPARYGFHATIKAPFRLAEGTTLDALDAALAEFCAGRAPFVLPRLSIRRLGGFFALVTETPPPALAALEKDVVMQFDAFRAPLTEAEIRRRRPERLTARQRDLLDRWGYPTVLEEFRFHMTLSGDVAEKNRDEAERVIRDHIGDAEGTALVFDRLALFVEPEPDAPFTIRSVHPFGAAPR